MIQAIYTSLSGMLNHRTRMDVLSNNIANINTTGFKTAQANFQDSLYRTFRAGSAQQNNPLQVGLGVTMASVVTNFAQGPLQSTGRQLDLAISGNGFFGLKKNEDTGDENLYYTREGSFSIDKDGYLVNSNGLRLVNKDGDVIQLNIPSNQAIDSINISNTGEIFVTFSDGSTNKDNVIGLFNFPNPDGLLKVGGNLFAANGDSTENPAGARVSEEPGKNGLGVILSGYLEMANVDLANELGNLIVTQRGYEANAKVFTTSDEVLRETIDLKR